MTIARGLAGLGLMLGLMGQTAGPEKKPAGAPLQGSRETPGQRPPSSDEGAPEPDPRIRELESAIWHEIALVESRLESIKKRLQAIAISPAEDAATHAAETPLKAMGPTAEEEKRYDALLERQASLLRKWRGMQGKTERTQGNDRAGDAGLERDKSKVRADLRSVLTEILQLREQVRAQQLDRLRRELDALEKAVRARQDERLRRSMVEARLSELLEEKLEEKREREPSLPR